MPQERYIADTLSVLTICLVAILILLGLFCILYTFYFRSRIRSQGLTQLHYFSGPWIIRITYIFLALWWGAGEFVRLELLRHSQRIFGGLSLRWQENICKCYIVSNLGFSEPCLLLALVFLLRSSLHRSGALSRKWNTKTAGFILLYSIPMIVLQLAVTVIGPKYEEELLPRLSLYFIKASVFSDKNDSSIIALCTYPLFSTIFLGIFATVLTGYLFWLSRRILHLVINKVLQKRVYAVTLSTTLFLLRILFLGLSVLFTPENAAFGVILFLAFISLLCCLFVGMWILVYLPVADSLALWGPQGDIESRPSAQGDEHNESVSLIGHSPGRESTDSENRGSISFRVKGRDGSGGDDDCVELSLFSPIERLSPSGSARVLGWPMVLPLDPTST